MRWAALAALAAAAAALALPAEAGSPPLGPAVVRVLVTPPGGAPAVVRVLVTAPGGVPEVATGFEAAPGRVVTVAHVLDGDGALGVRSGRVLRPARVLRVDRRNDLALLAVDGRVRRARHSAGDGPRLLLNRGARVVARPALVRRRIVAHVSGEAAGTRDALELGARIATGDSGAPLVDRRGRVLGIVFARSNDRPATAYAVDAGELAALLR